MFGNLLAAFGVAALKAELRVHMRRAGIRFAAALVTGLFALVAVGFGVAAFTVWLAGEIGTIGALLVTGGIFLFVAIVVHIAGRVALARPARARLADMPPPRPASSPPPPPPRDPDEPPPGSALGAVAVVGLAGFLLAREMFRKRS